MAEPLHPSTTRPYYSAPGYPGATDPTDLPLRELTDDAAINEYTEETANGELVKTVKSNLTGKLEDYILVTFKIDDSENPKNWSKAYKWYCTMVVSATCFVVAFSSSVITPDIDGVREEFHVSEEVALLSTTLFVIGFGLGPLVFAPLSEVIGRKPVYVVTLALGVIFVIPCAVAKNITTLLVCRAIDGIAFSAPMTLVGGTLSDLWRNEERGVPMATFSAAPFLGPALGPLIGGFLGQAKGWRWLYWIQLILSGVIWLVITFTMAETYTPTLLARRAKKLRKEKNSDIYVTEQDLDARPMAEQIRLFLVRPLQLLFLEPIVLLMSLYMSILYGLLYMFFIAYPIVYGGGKGFTPGSIGLMFIPLAIGVLISALGSPMVNNHYVKICQQYAPQRPPAEKRLIPMMFSCWSIPSGLFIFAWSSYPHLHWMGPAMGGFVVSLGFIFLYNSCNNYLVDTYQHQAASALAAKTFIRSIWGACCVLFTHHMYNRLGYQWATTLLAFIALACCAIPFGFYYKGAAIRQYSKYAFTEDEENSPAEK